jgi:hypothetical protein
VVCYGDRASIMHFAFADPTETATGIASVHSQV